MKESSTTFDERLDNIRAELLRLRQYLEQQPAALPPGKHADEVVRLLWHASINLDSADAAAMRSRGVKL